MEVVLQTSGEVANKNVFKVTVLKLDEFHKGFQFIDIIGCRLSLLNNLLYLYTFYIPVLLGMDVYVAFLEALESVNSYQSYNKVIFISYRLNQRRF